MNQRILKRAYLLAWAMILVLGLPFPSMAQDTTPIPKITPLWTVTNNFCPQSGDCVQMWRLSADGEHLFVYIIPTMTMYAFSKGTDKVVRYPNIEFHTIQDQWFDYFPVDDHSLLYPDITEGGILMHLDLLTGESHPFGVERGLKDCLSHDALYGFAPPFDAVHYIPTIHALMVCRIALDGSKDPVISTVDLDSGHVTDVLRLTDADYLNVVGGRDGFIYVEPGLSSYWSFIPQYRERMNSIHFILRWNAQTSDWNTFEIPDSTLVNSDWNFQRFMGVDAQSNLYFQNHDKEGENFKLKITQADSSGKIIRIIKADQLGWNSRLIGLDNTGKLIILNEILLPGSNTTVDVISRYDFDTTSSNND